MQTKFINQEKKEDKRKNKKKLLRGQFSNYYNFYFDLCKRLKQRMKENRKNFKFRKENEVKKTTVRKVVKKEKTPKLKQLVVKGKKSKTKIISTKKLSAAITPPNKQAKVEEKEVDVNMRVDN